MKIKIIITSAVFLVISSFFNACNKEESFADEKDVYLDLPQTPYSYSGGPNKVATLGRVLFYDKHLSVNNAIACASCHIQTLAFSDNRQFSRGFENRLTTRNSMPLQNVIGFSSGFGGSVRLFWDGRETSLQSMVIKPILNHIEMGMGDVKVIEERVRTTPYYASLFQDAFGSNQVDIELIATALTTFVSSITSSSTRFDHSSAGASTLNALEQQGENLFFNKYDCNSCHQTQMPNAYQTGGGGGFVNIGLDAQYSDNGVGEITKDPADNGKFKIPSLRNIELTAPYMHDGRFATLDEVMDFYSHGIQSHENIDSRLLDAANRPLRMNISSYEKGAIIAFLKTLTDHTMITDPKFSDPFKSR